MALDVWNKPPDRIMRTYPMALPISVIKILFNQPNIRIEFNESITSLMRRIGHT